MAEVFDPYHIWLGIPPEEQPADHYRLLGIRRFESNDEVISNAADQRVRHLRSMQTGKRQAETQKLLNEVAGAAAVLLDLEKKRKYDNGLSVQHSRTARTPLPVTQPSAGGNQQIRPAGSPTIQASGLPTALSLSGPATSPRHPHWAGWHTIGVLSAAAVALLVLVIALAMRKDDEPNQEPLNGNLAQRPVSPDRTRPPAVPTATTPATPKPAPITTANISPPPQVNPPPPQVTPPPSTTSPVPPVVVPMPPLVTPPPPAKLPPPVSTANLEHQKNWEYGYGRLNAAGNKVVEFHPLVFSAELHPDGTNTVRWGVGPHYPAAGPLDILHLRKDGGHTANDPSIVVIRRWRHPAKCVIKASGELEVPERGGDGVQVRLVTGNGERIWRTKDRGQRVSMDVNEFVLEENEPLDLCVDCNINHSFDTFKMRLHLAARFPDGKKDEWDSITDYRDPLPAGLMPATVDVAKPARFPVPGEASLTAARGKLKETFGDLAQKSKKPEEKLKLVAELRGISESEKDPAIRYSLLDLARNLATAGEDFATAVSIAQRMAEQYEIDESRLKLETLKLSGATALPASAWESAAELAAELAAAAQESGKLELADAASQLAVEYAGHSKNVEFKKGIKQLRDKVTAQLKLWEVVKAEEKTLQTSPDDPAANLAVGKWHCLYLGDWDKGIPQLAKSGDAKLAAAAVAEKELSALQAADAWSTAAEALSGAEMLAAQRHALALYQEASEELKGLEQLKAAKRVTELTEALAQGDSQLPATGGMVPRSKLTSDALRPGLLVRIYASQPPKVPTPALGVIQSYGDFAVRREQLARELNYDAARLCFTGIGYIDLDKEESLLFHVRNGILLVDGSRVIANNPAAPVTKGPKKKNKNPDLVRRTLKPGRHTLQVVAFDYNSDGPDFRVTRDNGSSVISYSPADLDAELARSVPFHGASVKGRFSLGNR